MLKFCIHSWLYLWGLPFAGMWCYVIWWKMYWHLRRSSCPIVRSPGNACSVLPKHVASHSRRWHSLWLLLWEQVSLQWHIFSHLHIANPCSYGLSVILALCGELSLGESTDLSFYRLWDEWMFIWSQIFVNVWLLQLLFSMFLFSCVCTLCTVPVTTLTVPRVKWRLPQTAWTGPATLSKELLRCFVCQERVESYLTTVWHCGLFRICPSFCFVT